MFQFYAGICSSLIFVSLRPTSSNTYKRQYTVRSVNRFHLVYKVYRDNREENLWGRAWTDSAKLETSTTKVKWRTVFLFERTQDVTRPYFQLLTWLGQLFTWLSYHQHSSRSADTKREPCSLTHLRSYCDFLTNKSNVWILTSFWRFWNTSKCRGKGL